MIKQEFQITGITKKIIVDHNPSNYEMRFSKYFKIDFPTPQSVNYKEVKNAF